MDANVTLLIGLICDFVDSKEQMEDPRFGDMSYLCMFEARV